MIKAGQLRMWTADAFASEEQKDPTHFLVLNKREHDHPEEGWYILEGGYTDWEWENIITNYSEIISEPS